MLHIVLAPFNTIEKNGFVQNYSTGLTKAITKPNNLQIFP